MTPIRICAAMLSLLGTAAGCTGTQRPAVVSPSGAGETPNGDVGVVAAALGFFAGRTEGVLQVEPRPLRPDASLQGVRQRDLDGADVGVVHGRTAYLARRGIRTTDAAADMRCAFSRGVQPPDSLLRLEPDSIRFHRQACLARGVYTTYAFGMARPASASVPAATLRVRVYRITTWSFEVWDIDLRSKRRGFEVIGARRLGGVAS
jgi:hypothetical protein